MEYSAQAAVKAANAIRARADARRPSIGIILGSGLGGLGAKIADAVRIPFGDIPGFPEATVVGHEGTMLLGNLGGRDVVALSGRFHVYEGPSATLCQRQHGGHPEVDRSEHGHPARERDRGVRGFHFYEQRQ